MNPKPPTGSGKSVFGSKFEVYLLGAYTQERQKEGITVVVMKPNP